jgi:hypothetical protein
MMQQILQRQRERVAAEKAAKAALEAEKSTTDVPAETAEAMVDTSAPVEQPSTSSDQAPTAPVVDRAAVPVSAEQIGELAYMADCESS